MNKRKYLAADVGSKTIGLAISSGFIANPLETIRFEQYDFENGVEQLTKLCVQHKITDIVIGYPVSMNNKPNQTTEMVDYVIKLLNAHIEINNKINIHTLDERLTTNLANQYMLTANLTRKKRKTKKDTLAAQIILNSFLKKQGITVK